MGFGSLPGNEALKRQLSAQARGRGLSHAYLIAGSDGAGRDALAALLSAAMVCTGEGEGEKPCGVCPGCKKALSGIHPDVIDLDIPADKREILVEQIRALRSDAYVRPNEAPRKVYLIRNAQAMNRSAQNALLKVLEEGPPYAAFLLLTDNPAALLPTIRSRCELLTLAPSTGGEGEETEEVRAAARRLVGLFAQGDELELAAWCVSLEKWDREALSRLLTRSVALLRDALALQLSAPAFPGPEDAPALRAAAALPRRKLLSAVDALEALQSHTRFNIGAGHLCGALCAALGEL